MSRDALKTLFHPFASGTVAAPRADERFLFIGAILVLVAGIANVFIQSSALMITLSVLVIGIFSAFILYDLKRVQDGEETNYISATLGVYLSLYNVFQSLLALLGVVGGRDE